MVSYLPSDLPTEKKRFFNFTETWHSFSTWKVNIFIFGVKRNNSPVGLNFTLKLEILGFLVQKPPRGETFFSMRSGQFIRDFLNKIYVGFLL